MKRLNNVRPLVLIIIGAVAGVIISCSKSIDNPQTELYGAGSHFEIMFDDGSESEFQNQTILRDERIKEPDVYPLKEGKVFGGWYISKKFFGQPFDFNTIVYEDTRLYAKWLSPTPDEVFDFDAGTGAIKGTLENRDTLIIPNSIGGSPVNEIKAGAFQGGNTNVIYLPTSLKRIGGEAFLGSAIEYIYIPNSVEDFGAYLFREVSSIKKSFNFPNKLTSFPEGTYALCEGLTTVSFPDSTKVLGTAVCYGCVNLTDIIFPNRLENIGSNAFINCVALEKVDVPASIKNIGDNAFGGSVNLKTVVIRAPVPPILGSNVFTIYGDGGPAIDCEFRVPPTSVTAYQNSPSWALYKNQIKAIQ